MRLVRARLREVPFRLNPFCLEGLVQLETVCADVSRATINWTEEDDQADQTDKSAYTSPLGEDAHLTSQGH
jgi:hypothetical protein